jgi:hypothetical protein
MSESESTTPVLAQVILDGIAQVLANIHTAMPGQIEEYDAAKNLAKVKPLFKRKYHAEDAAVDLPIISNVPVVFQRTTSAFFRLPVKKGDYVLLIFCERSLDLWLENGGSVDPQDPTKFGLNDAVAIPGLFPKTITLEKNGAEESLEIANKTAYIEIKSNGDIAIKTSGNITVDSAKATVTTSGDTKVTASGKVEVSGSDVKVTGSSKVVLDSTNVKLGDESGQALALKSDLGLILVTAPPGGGPCVVSAAACIGTIKTKAS